VRRRAARAAALLLWLLVRTPPAGADEPCGECRAPRDLSRLFVQPAALGAGWDTVAETPTDPAADPDLRASGVRAVHNLHYTRPIPGGSQVCSIELWAFHTPEQAQRARAELAREDWYFSLQGDLMLMARGVTLERGRGFRPGLLPECRRLAGLIEARAATSMRRASGR
jgi:hypothetical protein